jgi:hypothetical protein
VAFSVLQALDDLTIIRAQRGRVSIDGHRPDAALASTELTFAGAPLHHTTNQAVGNVEALAAREVVALVGHGASAAVSTGCGDDWLVSTDDNQMNLLNSWAWEQFLQGLRGDTKLLMLVSCATGWGTQGTKFLWQIACAIDGTAAAPTNTLYVGPTGRIWGAWRTGWHYVECGEEPVSRYRRTGLLSQAGRRFVSRVRRAARRGAAHGPSALGVPLIEVVGVRYTPLASGQEETSFEGQEATNLLSHVDPTADVVPNGAPLSFPTGRLAVFTEGRVGESEHTFTVYGGYLLRDDSRPELFYEADEGFMEMLGGWTNVIGSLLGRRGQETV